MVPINEPKTSPFCLHISDVTFVLSVQLLLSSDFLTNPPKERGTRANFVVSFEYYALSDGDTLAAGCMQTWVKQDRIQCMKP